MQKLITLFIFMLSASVFAQTCNEDWELIPDNPFISTPGPVLFTYTGAANAGATLDINFGDGATQTFVLTTGPLSFSHNYTSEGIFNASYVLSGTCSQTKSLQIVVSSISCADSTFVNGDLTICVNTPAPFEVNLPANPNGVLQEIVWNMGDGTFITNTVNNINYIYLEPGNYSRSVAVHYYDSGSGQDCYYLAQNNLTGDYSHKSFALEGQGDFTIVPASPTPGALVDFVFTGTIVPLYGPPWPWTFFIDSSFANNGTNAVAGDVLYTSTFPAGYFCAQFETFLRDGATEFCKVQTEVCFNVSDTDCDTCNSFKPGVGDRYWMSAWVKVDEPTQVKSYNPTNLDNSMNLPPASLPDAYLELEFYGTPTTVQLFPMGNIIDGWQRIVGEFTIPSGTYDLGVNLYADDIQETYFDDIRIHPFNSSMKSYVYDGETFWLVSELDDNNYATFYEYDEEGGLVRIKKETERGIVTIQETRSNTTKDNP